MAYNWCWDIIFEYFDVYSKFYEDAHKDMADSLIRWGGWLSVAKNIWLFNWWTIEKLMNELINQHQESIILENPEVFWLEKE